MKINKKIALIIVIILVLTGMIAYLFLNKSPHQTSEYRNGLRLKVVRQLASSLELYYEDFGQYPESLQELIPNYMEELSYFPAITVENPFCPAEEPFQYKIFNNGSDYTMRFCMPEKDSRYTAGFYKAGPSGIKPEEVY